MSIWTSDFQEISHMSEISSQLAKASLILVTLESGDQIEGVVRGQSTGNNASSLKRDGRCLYFGNFDLETLEGKFFNIDMIAVKSIANVWAKRSADYEKAGLISIIK